MKVFLGFVLLVLAIVLGLYVGGYLLFFGGMVQVFSSLSPIVPVGIAVGVVKVFFSGFVGWTIFVVLGYTGLGMIK